jgi:hypothetical protein
MENLIDTSFPAEYGVPPWAIFWFRVLGFALHAAFMGLWYAGIPLAVALTQSPNEQFRVLSRRLMRQMPAIVAFGINMGIVPLLFLQVGFAPIFYSATILMAWHWLAIIGLLIVGYYGVYLYSWTDIPTDQRAPAWRVTLGAIVALMFLTIGFFFANGFSLMHNGSRWVELWQRTEVAGATTGLTLNVGDPTFWPRWLYIFSLAILTTAAWMVLDAHVFAWQASAEYRRHALLLARNVYSVGLIAVLALASWHYVATGQLQPVVLTWPNSVATLLAVGLPIILAGWLWAQTSETRELRPKAAVVFTLMHVLVLASHGFLRVSADVARIVSAYRFWDRPVNIQWGPIVLFGVTLVAGIIVVSWMIIEVVKHVTKAPRAEAGGAPQL